MTDFHNKNETPNYEPLTDTNSCQQNELTPEEPPIQISEPINSYGRNVTYRTPCQCSCKVCALLYGVFLSCVAMSAFIISIGIYQNQIKLIFIGLFPLIHSSIILFYGSSEYIFDIINISPTLGTILFKSISYLFCIDKRKVIQINDLDKVCITTSENSFEIIFKLSDGKEFRIYAGKCNGKVEGRKASQILRNALPQRVKFSGI